MIVFGSLARGEAGAGSDLDVVVVRPASVGEDDEAWALGLEEWRRQAQRLTGNRVEVVELGEGDVGRLLRGRRQLWVDIKRDGVVVFGRQLAELQGRRSA